MEFYNDKRKSVNMRLFGDIYVSFGFIALIITDSKLSARRNAVCSNKLKFKTRDEWKF